MPAAGIAPTIVQPVVRALRFDLTEKPLFSRRHVEYEECEIESDEEAAGLVGEGKASSKFRVEGEHVMPPRLRMKTLHAPTIDVQPKQRLGLCAPQGRFAQRVMSCNRTSEIIVHSAFLFHLR